MPQFQITFTGLTADELAEVVDAFAGNASRGVIVSSPGQDKYDVVAPFETDCRWGAHQLDHLHGRLERLAERQMAIRAQAERPVLAGKPVTFDGDETLFVQIDGFDVVGLEVTDDGKAVVAWPIDANAEREEGDKTHDGRVVWPPHPARRRP